MLTRKIICHLVNNVIPENLLDSLLVVVQQYVAEEMNRRARNAQEE